MKRYHYFNVTTCDSEGRTASTVIRHTERNITGPIINQQLAEVGSYQPVAVTGINYLGLMSQQYFETGIKVLTDYPFIRSFAGVLLVAVVGFAVYGIRHSL